MILDYTYYTCYTCYCCSNYGRTSMTLWGNGGGGSKIFKQLKDKTFRLQLVEGKQMIHKAFPPLFFTEQNMFFKVSFIFVSQNLLNSKHVPCHYFPKLIFVAELNSLYPCLHLFSAFSFFFPNQDKNTCCCYNDQRHF